MELHGIGPAYPRPQPASGAAPPESSDPRDTVSTTRQTARRIFGKPTTREVWRVQLPGTVSLPPTRDQAAFTVALDQELLQPGDPAPQRIARLHTSGEFTHAPVENYAMPPANQTAMSWQTSVKPTFDGMIGWYPEYIHTEIRIQGPGFERASPDQKQVQDSRPFPWGPQPGPDRTVIPLDKRSLECLGPDGRTLWRHEGTPWAKLEIPPGIGPDGRAVIPDNNHGVLTCYAPDGAWLWEETLFKTIRCSPLPQADGTTYVVARSEKSGHSDLRRLDSHGKTQTSWEISGSSFSGISPGPDGTLVIAAADPPRLIGLDPNDGVRWEHPLPVAPASAPLTREDTVTVVLRDGQAMQIRIHDPQTAPELPPDQEKSGIHADDQWVTVGGVRVRRPRR